jgi:Tfp pilus assembly protein PilF
MTTLPWHGVCYLRLNQVDLAEAEFETALRLKPDAPLVRKHLEHAALRSRRGSKTNR